MSDARVVADAMAQAGVPAAGLEGASVLVDPDGVALRVEVVRRSLVTDEVARRLLDARDSGDATLMLDADRVTQGARSVLDAAHAGYLDRRGRLSLRAPGLFVAADIEPVRTTAARSDALAGRAGAEIAATLLLDPARRRGVRELGRELGRSAGTVSHLLALLRGDGLIGQDNRPLGTELFWALVPRWPSATFSFVRAPDLADPVQADALRMGLFDHGAGPGSPGWALTGTLAAAAYGAPVAARRDQVPDCYVPDEITLRRAERLLGAAPSGNEARITLRLAPVPSVVTLRTPAVSGGPWPLAHPLFVALDLAKDAGRGREVLEHWDPAEEFTRVW